MQPQKTDMTYQEKLQAVKVHYPFEKWSEAFYPDENDVGGMEQYSAENCDTATGIMDNLIADLQAAGENAAEQTKLALFEKAIKAYNDLNDEISGFIETGEREDLCEVLDMITIAAGLQPSDYADGEGISDLWREW